MRQSAESRLGRNPHMPLPSVTAELLVRGQGRQCAVITSLAGNAWQAPAPHSSRRRPGSKFAACSHLERGIAVVLGAAELHAAVRCLPAWPDANGSVPPAPQPQRRPQLLLHLCIFFDVLQQDPAAVSLADFRKGL